MGQYNDAPVIFLTWWVIMSTDDLHGSRKEKEEEFRRNLVLNAAEELFAEKGFEGTTVADIARASELAKGSLYQIFENKEEIIEAMVGRKMLQIHTAINQIISRPGDPVDKVLELMAHKLTMIWEDRRFARILINELKGFHWFVDSPCVVVHKDEIDKLRVRLEGLFQEGQRLGRIRGDVSPGMLLAAFGGLTNGVVFRWLMVPDSMDLNTAIREAQALLLHGVSPCEEGN